MLDLADPTRTEPFGLRCRGGDVGNLHIEVQPILDGLVLGHLLESKSSPSRRIDETPGRMTLHSFAAQHTCPESGQHQGFRTVDNDLVNPADHDVRVSTAQLSRPRA